MFFFLKEKGIDYIPTLLFVFAAIMWRTQYYQLCLYVAIPAMILYTFLKRRSSVFQCKYWKTYTMVMILILLSTIVNDFNAEAISILVPITATYLVSLSIYGLSVNGHNSRILCIAFIGLYVSLMYATITGEAFVSDFDYANEADRRSNTVLNSNQYAYFSLFAIMAIRVLIGCKDKLGAFTKIIIYLVLLLAACYTAFMTASRQVLLLEVPLIGYFFYHDFLEHGKGVYRGLFVIAIVFFILYGLPLFFQIYDNSYLAVRSESSISEDSRTALMMAALDLGFEYPIFGVGLNADTTYSHCTYTHLFSRCGILSCILYVYMVFNAIAVQYKRALLTHDSYYNILSVCLILFAIANFFYSYIDQPYMLPILFLLIGESDRHTQEYYSTVIID